MAIKNIKGLLTQATAFPAAIEAKLPEGAPKVSTMLLDAANQIPAVPDFPMEIPDLPAPPELPAMPAGPGPLARPFAGPELAATPRSTIVAPQAWLGGNSDPRLRVGPTKVIERRGF